MSFSPVISVDPLATEGMACTGISRVRVTMQGVVQGVGFRPFVYRLAHSLRLSGWVSNTADGVVIEVEGSGEQRTAFLHALQSDAPPLARITAVNAIATPPLGTSDFTILACQADGNHTLLPPDVATCAQCVQEIGNPQERRFGYAFTNCTNCGPRFSIVQSLPYDRATTTMAVFSLCSACAAEYANPGNRRFHAEPIACPSCGPQLWLEMTAHGFGCLPTENALSQTATLLRHGAVIAVQGLGGFYLACDATNDEAVLKLRAAKTRPAKPLAVMLATLEEAHQYAHISEAEAALLTSTQAPIVLVQKKTGSPLSATIAPGNAYFGLMLPYTPQHHLLIRETGRPLVMTSGNRRDEPLCQTAEEARQALGRKVDALLLHDRPIQQRCDDSVFFVGETGPQPIRRSRGYTPSPIQVPIASPVPVLALGAELKNTFCLLREQGAILSQHIGDMGSLATQQHFFSSLEHFKMLFNIAPAAVAHDLHPGYTTTQYARTLGLPLIGVQHHHAHVAACLADNGVTGPVIGVVFDGTGYGTDETIWGGEFLVADLCHSRRITHLEYLPLPGGEAAIRHPARIAMAYLIQLFGELPAIPFLKTVPLTEQRLIRRMLKQRVNTPLTSSCGRLFDAVAAIIGLLGLRGQVTYEGQAAIELETISSGVTDEHTVYPFTVGDGKVGLKPLLGQVISDVEAGVSPGIIGRRFHHTLAEIVQSVCSSIRESEGLSAVALSGGCWQNRLLLAATVRRLRDKGFTVYTHKQVPTNDGGVSVGQAAVAAARLAEPNETAGDRLEKG